MSLGDVVNWEDMKRDKMNSEYLFGVKQYPMDNIKTFYSYDAVSQIVNNIDI